jgi:hypothetical protein
MIQYKLACTLVSAYNVHKEKCAGMEKEGGTGTICFGDFVGYIKKTGKDNKGLGRWRWVLLGRNNGHNARIITAYNPCKNKNLNLGTSYQQQRRTFITKKKYLTCPLILFQKHLVRQIKQWQASGDRINLFMDHNEHVTNRPIGKELEDKDGLDLRKALVKYTGKIPGATFFRGSKPIVGMWVSSNLEISNACMMPFRYGVSNHHAFVLDVPLESLIGVDPVKIIRLVGQRLNSRLPGCSKSYIDSLEANIIKHHLLKQLFDAHTGAYSDVERARRIIIIDKEGKAYMRQAEKICRKIKCCRIPFSPEAAI